MKKGFSKKGKEFLLRRILPVGVVLAACTCGAYVVNSAQYNDHFLPGTIINGIDVSDLTLQQAEASIRKNEEAYKLTIKFRGGTEQVLSKKDLGLSYDCTNELQQLMNQQNSHAWLSRQLGAPSEVTLTSTSCRRAITRNRRKPGFSLRVTGSSRSLRKRKARSSGRRSWRK